MKKLNRYIYTIMIVVITAMLITGCGKKDEVKEDKINNQDNSNTTSDNKDIVIEDKDTENIDTENTDIENTTQDKDTEDNSDSSSDEPAVKSNVNVAVLKGPTAIGMVKIMEADKEDKAANNYEFMIAGAADEVSAGLIKGDIDIAAIPCNLASVLYNKTEGKIKIAGINTLGVLYIVETGDTIKSVEDLKGKTIYSTGFGTTPQYTLNYLLNSYGIDPAKDVTIEYKTEAAEVAAMLSSSEDAVAMLPQPYVTTVMMNNDKIRIALSVEEEWNKISADSSSVVTGVLVVRTEFLDNNKDAFSKFMEEYKLSTEFVNENIDEASALVEGFDIFKAVVAKKAIPYCNITLIEGQDMKDKVSAYLKALYDQEPVSVGGKLPEDNFYYIR